MNLFSRFWLVVLFALFLPMGCGDEKSQYDVEQKVSGITWPTLQNAHAWREIWDGRSWIVALSRQRQQLKSNSFFRAQLIQSFANKIRNSDPDLTAAVELNYRISSLIQSSVLAIPNLEKSLSNGHGPFPVFGFATLSFRGGMGGLEQLLLASPLLSRKIGALDEQGKSHFLLRFMWDTLENTPGVEFAEPDLESQVQQEATPIESAMRGQFNTNILGVAELVPQMLKSGQSLVAVIDTGVDSSLDAAGKAMAGRFFRNPGEDPEKGKRADVDDDGNGWIDDYIGIDATVAKGGIDQSPMPVPGSNDVGGQGVPCDPSSGEGASSCSHGTHVAGIIAGGAQTPGEYVGVCPFNCQILPIRAARRCFGPKGETDSVCQPADESTTFNPETQREFNGGITDSAQLRGLSYLLDLESPTSPGNLATNVVNLSLGKYFSSRALSLIARRLFQNDVLIVAAAGNQNVEVPMFPAAYRDVVAVCSTSTDAGQPEPTGSGAVKNGSAPARGVRFKSRFSNFGDWVDICAPGSFIESSVPGGDTKEKSGTSQASPHVSGVAGLLKALRPSLSAIDIRSILLRYSDFDFLYGLLPDGRLANSDFAYAPYTDIKVFLLGSGELSALNAFYSLTDPSKARISQANSAIESGDTSQVTSGCVVSSLAANHPRKNLERSTSMPVVLVALLLFLKLAALFRKKTRPSAGIQ